MEDGTGVPLDGVGVVALEGGWLSIMVAWRWKRTLKTDGGRTGGAGGTNSELFVAEERHRSVL